MSQPTFNPWAVQYGRDDTEIVDAASRIDAILRSNNRLWLQSVLRWSDNQMSVRVAAERRLRLLAKGAK